MISSPIPEALTFDDVLLVPAYSEVVPTQVSTCRYGHVSPPPDASGKCPYQLLGYGPADRAHRLSQAPIRRLYVRAHTKGGHTP